MPPVLEVTTVAVLVHEATIGEFSPAVLHTAPPVMVGCSLACSLSSPVLPRTLSMPPVLEVTTVAVLVHEATIGEFSPAVLHTAPPVMVGCSLACSLSS